MPLCWQHPSSTSLCLDIARGWPPMAQWYIRKITEVYWIILGGPFLPKMASPNVTQLILVPTTTNQVLMDDNGRDLCVRHQPTLIAQRHKHERVGITVQPTDCFDSQGVIVLVSLISWFSFVALSFWVSSYNTFGFCCLFPYPRFGWVGLSLLRPSGAFWRVMWVVKSADPSFH